MVYSKAVLPSNMAIYIYAPFLDQLTSTLSSIDSVKCVEDFSTVFSSSDHPDAEHWFTCDDRLQVLRYLQNVSQHTAHLFASCETDIPQTNKIVETSRRIHGHLNNLAGELRKCLQCPESRSSCHSLIMKSFKDAFKQLQPIKMLDDLYKVIITGAEAESNFEVLYEQSNSVSSACFKEWCEFAILTCFRIHLFYMVYLNQIQEMDFPQIPVDYDAMIAKFADIMDRLHTAMQQGTKRFFTPNNIQRTEIMELIDGYITEFDREPMSHNREIADKIGAKLNEISPDYAWCVVVAEDTSKMRNTMIYSDDHAQALFLQESIHWQTVPLITQMQAPRHEAYSQGTECGVVTVAKKVAVGMEAHQRRITVFWKKLRDQNFDLAPEAREVLSKVDVRDLVSVSEECVNNRNTVRSPAQDHLEDAVFGMNVDYVVCMGLQQSRTGGELGVYSSRNGWLQHVENKSGHILLWLCEASPATLEYRVNKSTLFKGLKAMSMALLPSLE
ncbi:uncharacterized protein LOC129592444 [Paramacrobiotus metropolitanus]|uniref:uncharacterized protein LOC129592444 n=1 Tax=Paramacrobiotus metropolitanus TaxID=2943436 RepID=UPI0024464932|nr:uncharacterized protein LOC129592444 [Paramacrobiotus metropolitanus]